MVRCRAGGLDAAALVDGDIHDHAAVLHVAQVLFADKSRGLGAGDQHGPDDEVGLAQVLANSVRVAEDGVDVGRHHVVEVAEPVEVDVH